MRRFPAVCVLIAMIVSAPGCTSVAGPRWGNPGTSAYQQARAQRFDPYPEDETGPKIVGARPREFSDAIAEPARARWNPRSWFGF